MLDKDKSVFSLTAFYFAISCFGASFAFAAWDGSRTKPLAGDTIIPVDAGDKFVDVTLPLYHISTPEQLAGLAELINVVETPSEDPTKDPGDGGATVEPTAKAPWQGYVVLDNDIVFGSDKSSVSDFPWVPIGNAKGLIEGLFFDGKNHTIYGLNLASKKDTVFGLFGFVDYGEFKNVTLANYSASFGADSSVFVEDFLGGSLVGYAAYSKIHNVHTRDGLIKFEALPRTKIGDEVVGVNHVIIGNIVGEIDGDIDSCSNASDIEVHFDSYQKLGGIVGSILAPGVTILLDSISYCSNTGKIVSKSQSTYQSSEVGGIAGSASAFIFHSRNAGSIAIDYGYAGGISGSGKHAHYCENTGSISGGRYAGGIFGLGAGIRWCTNKGHVDGFYAGGIIGDGGSVYFSVNEGDVRGTYAGGISGLNADVISQSINRGQLEGGTVGGICGENVRNIYSSYSYTNKVNAKDVVGGIVGINSGYVWTSAYDSTLLPSVSLLGVEKSDSKVVESFALSTKQMQSAEFADKLNEAMRDDGKTRMEYDDSKYPRLTWSFDGGYPIFGDSLHLPVYRIDLDDSVFVSYALTDDKGHIVDLPPAYSTQGRYFEGWVDSTGKSVSKSTVFNGPATIYAKYSKTVKDPSLVVYRPDPTVIGWNGELSVPKWRMHLDTSLYLAIFTPSELAWYLSKGAVFTRRAALVNDIVMGKDSLSVMTRELKTISEYGRYDGNYIFDGNNHNVYGLNHYLFDTNYGEIKNLHLVNYLVKNSDGAFANTNRGKILKSSLRNAVVEKSEGNAYIDGFVELNYNGAVIDSCVNYSNYEVSSNENLMYIAGIAYENRGTVSNSRNLGNIKVEGGWNTTNIAGITVINGSTGVILNSVNEGNLEYIGTQNVLLAGISTDNRSELIKGCENYGKISARLSNFSAGLHTGTANPAYVAGIVKDANELDSCANYGDITVVGAEQFGGGVIFGGVVAGPYIHANIRNSLNKGSVSFVDSSSYSIKDVKFGGIAGEANVYSSKNEGNVEFVQTNPSKEYNGSEKVAVGGIVAEPKIIKDCVNEGDVIGLIDVGGIAAITTDTVLRVVNRGRVEGLGFGLRPGVGGICGQCRIVENAINVGEVALNKSKEGSKSYVGGIGGNLALVRSMKKVANTASVKAFGNGNDVYAGGLFGSLDVGVLVEDAYNWGEVSTDGVAGGIYGVVWTSMYDDGTGRYYVAEMDLKNIYNAAPVHATSAANTNPIGVLAGCEIATDPDFQVLVYNDSTNVHEKGCVEMSEFRGDVLVQYFVWTSPLSTKYMQSDDFVDLLNTSGKTVENRHVWKKSETYPVFDEESLGMSFSYEPLSSSSVASSSSLATSASSSSATKTSSSSITIISSSSSVVNLSSSSSARSSSSVVKSSSSVTVRSSSSSAKAASSSSAIKSSSSSKAKSSSSSVKSSSSAKPASSSSSVKSSSSGKAKSSSSVKRSSSSATGLKALVQRSFRVRVQGRTIVLLASRGERVQVFDALGHLVASKHVNAAGDASIALEKAGTYIVRVDGLDQIVVLK